ncbi:MAG TPA: alanine--tRNA ligase-related protein, partial [Candidatus Nitrosocosmicus sp.]|nr:alanine--tRNA ligase-related protein [Candidatus Nitrosocosmicus sp.]
QRDNESIEILQDIFKKYNVSYDVAPDNVNGDREIDLNKYRIFPYSKENNWWQRGDAIGELGGPDAETFYDLKIEHDVEKWGYAHPATDSGRFIEIGNSVFMQYKKTEHGWEELNQKNVDFGGGLERLLMVVQNKSDIYSTDLYKNSIDVMETFFKANYETDSDSLQTKAFRIIADHIKGAVFMAADGVVPANKEQGYVLRRAIRRAVKFAYLAFNTKENFSNGIVEAIIKTYADVYPDLNEKKQLIKEIISTEEKKFWTTFIRGIEIATKYIESNKPLDGTLGFTLYETYGMPPELTIEYFKENKKDVDEQNFWEEFNLAEKDHKNLSRVGAEKRFKGGLADTKEVTVRYHTAAHLMLAAMQKVLGPDVHQKGQNITDERLRFDINFPRELTKEEINKIEEQVNLAIQKELTIEIEQMKKEDIRIKGAEGSFMDRYGDVVDVYKMFDSKTGEVFSYEVCGGPHVKNTSEILESGQFKIVKEESSGAGIRRIKAVFIK